MSFEALSETFAADVQSGALSLTELKNCEKSLTPRRLQQFVRFTQIKTFTDPAANHLVPPRYLALQPQKLSDSRAVERLQDAFTKQILDPFMERWQTGLLADLPDARGRDLARRLQDFTSSDTPRTGRLGGREWSTLLRSLRNDVEAQITEDELRVRYNSWVVRYTARAAQECLRAVQTACGGRLQVPPSVRPLNSGDVRSALNDLVFPGPFQPLDSIHPLVAVCAIYEQVWEPCGYSRGELLSSLTLAPGERVSLEVFAWDKSTSKSEDELATESEMRTSEKLTQRDALTTAQEYAHQHDTKVEAGGTVPIPDMPVKVGVTDTDQIRESTRQTTDSLREDILESSNTLKVNRKTRVEVGRDVGRETRQTRTVENTNRCHSLNCFYFEVMNNYLVTTHLASVRPCVLLRNPRPAMTLDWILCHQGTLISALLDPTFLPGFEGARVTKTAQTMDYLDLQARAAALTDVGDRLAPFATAVAEAYRTLRNVNERAEEAFTECGGNNFCVDDSLGGTAVEQLFSYYGLTDVDRSALDGLISSLANNRNPATALQALFSVVSPELQPRSKHDTEQAMTDHFSAYGAWYPAYADREIQLMDDAGLRGSTRAAADALRATPLPAATPEGTSGLSRSDEATALVELGRLRCHLYENWLHYAQAVWRTEDHDQRFVRLQAVWGPVVNVIENELLGFYGDRAAYPLLSTETVSDIDLAALVEALLNDAANTTDEPILITMPTSGVVLEASIGECNACEDYINRSRVIDLQLRKAQANQEQAEADRRTRRLQADDLSEFVTHTAEPTDHDDE